jgi:hypothetical protein
MSIQNAESLLRSPLDAGSSPDGFYALNALLDSISPITSVNVIVIVAYQLAMVGIYLFGHRLGMNVIGAVTAAAAFTFGGLVIFLVSDIGTISHVTSAIWIPWIMLAIENLHQSQRWRWVVIGSLCTAFQLFFGEPQTVLFTFLTGLAYAAYRMTCGQKRLYFATTVTMMWLCGFMMVKAQVQTFMESVKQATSSYGVADLLHSGSGIIAIIYLTLLILLSLLVANHREQNKRSLGFWTIVAFSCILFALIIPEIQQTIRYLYETRIILDETRINRLFTEPAAYLYVCVLCASILIGFATDFILPARRENISWSLLSMFSAVLLFITTAAIIGASLTWKKNHVLAEHISNLKSEPWEEYIKTHERDFDTFRIFTHSLKTKDKLPAENIAPHNLSKSSLNANSINSKGAETLTAENVSSIFKGVNGEAALPDINSLTSRNQLANLLNVKYLILERSGELSPPPGIQMQGIKFDQSSAPIQLEPGKPHSEILTPETYASEIAIISAMGAATGLIDNTPIAKIKLHTKDGRIITQEVLVGRDTGEWSYDNPEIRRNIKHRRPTIALDTSSNGVFSYQYLMRLPFERSEISQIEFDYLLADAVLLINHISLFDSKTGASTPLSSFDIITNQWRKLAQYGDVEIYQNRKFLPRARFIKKATVASRASIMQILNSGLAPDGSVFNASDTVLLESENLGSRGVEVPEIADPIDPIVSVSKRMRDKISLEVQNNRSGFLVLSELYRSGLECYIDGHPADVMRVNYALSGIPVPAGNHTIQLVYRPFGIDSETLYALFGIIILSVGAVAQVIGADRILNAVQLRKWTKAWVPKVRSYRPAFFIDSFRSIAQSRIIDIIRSITRSRIVTFIRLKYLIALAVLGLLAYGYVMVRYSTYSLGGTDAWGYGSFGKLIYLGQVVQPVRLLADLDLPAELQDAFIPLAYGPGRTPGIMISEYPVGFPLQIAVAAAVFGLEIGPWLVASLAATLSLVLIWLIGVEFGLSRKLAFGGAVILGLFPTIPYIGIQLLSDVPAMFWSLAVIFAALRSRKNAFWAIIAGFAFGMGFMTRPTNILLIAATLLSLRWSLKTISYFVIGGLPTACILFIYNFVALGSPMYLGYGVSGAGGNFHLHFLPTHFNQFTYWLSMLTSPLLLIGWLAVIVNKQISLRDRSIIIIWFGAFFLLYGLYGLQYDTESDWMYTRFLLPGIPPLIIGSLMTTRSVVDSLKKNVGVRYHNLVSGFAFGFLLIVVIGVSISRIVRLDLPHFASNFGRHKESCFWADKLMPQGALVISMEMGGSIEYYANRQTLRYDMVKPAQWNIIKDHAMRKERSFYAFLMTHEVPLAKKNITGKWEELGVYKTLFTLWKVTPE